MSQLLNLEVDILAYNSTSISNDPSDALKISNTNVNGKSITDVSRLIMPLTAGGSLQSIALPNSPTNYIVIFSDQQVSIQLNGAGPTLVLMPPLAGSKAPLFMYLGPVTGLSIQASGTNNANVDIWLMY